MSDTILKGDQLRCISANIGTIWCNDFRDLNVKDLQHTTGDG